MLSIRGGFAADTSFVGMMGFNMGAVLPFSALPSTPADGTLVREMNHPEVFVVFGGAKFYIPESKKPHWSFSFDPNQVRVIPPGGTAQLRTMPIDGTLLKQQHYQKVYLVDNGQLTEVSPEAMDARCLPWRHIRIVPDNALAALLNP